MKHDIVLSSWNSACHLIRQPDSQKQTNVQIKVQWHTFSLIDRSGCLIETFVPHKISFVFCFIGAHAEGDSNYTWNFNRLQTWCDVHISWTLPRRHHVLCCSCCCCSSSSSSSFSLVHHYRVCVLQNRSRWNGIQPMHMLVITREKNEQQNRCVRQRRDRVRCIKHTDYSFFAPFSFVRTNRMVIQFYLRTMMIGDEWIPPQQRQWSMILESVKEWHCCMDILGTKQLIEDWFDHWLPLWIFLGAICHPPKRMS